MKRLAVAALCLASAVSANAGDVSVVLGSARTLTFVDVDIPCPENSICMDAWFRYDLSIEKVISGPAVPSRISAARIQHADFVPSYRKSIRVFVLRPITSAEDRAVLNADYYIDDLSVTHELYCLAGTPEDLGIDMDTVAFAEDGKFCFSDNEKK